MHNSIKNDLLLQSQTTVAFIPALCYVVGLKESIILQQIHYLVFNAEGKNLYADKEWFYCTYEQLHLMLPFESATSISRTVRKLVDEELLVADNLNRINRIKTSSKFYDQTKWYRINYEKLEYIIERKLETMLPDVIEKLTVEQQRLEHLVKSTIKIIDTLSPDTFQSELYKETLESWGKEPFHSFATKNVLSELIKRQLNLINNIMGDRNPDSSELWKLNKVKSLIYYEEINTLIEKSNKYIFKYKKNPLFSPDCYYSLQLLLSVTKAYAYDYNME